MLCSPRQETLRELPLLMQIQYIRDFIGATQKLKRRIQIEGSDPYTCLCYRCCALEQGTERHARCAQRGQAICMSVRPVSTKDCTSGNERRTQNACASVPIRMVSYSYTVIVPCTVLYDVPINVTYKTLSKYFIEVLSFVPLVGITQTASRVGPDYTLHSRN